MRAPTCITSTTVMTEVTAINTISATAIPMIFRLIDSRIIARISPEVRLRQHNGERAAAISAIDRD